MASTPKSPRARSGTTSSVQSMVSSVKNVSGKVLDADVPLGMWAATANATSMAPTISDIRSGSFGPEGWCAETQKENAIIQQEAQTQAGGSSPIGRRLSTLVGRSNTFKPDAEPLHETAQEADVAHTTANTLAVEPIEEVPSKEERAAVSRAATAETLPTKTSLPQLAPALTKQRTKTFPNGYIEPPKIPWTKSTAIGLVAFWKWFLTPFGFLVTIYGLNVVAWGGMLFLLLCGAAPAMCSQPSPSNDFNGCNDINSPRRIWLEIDSQILNALFCVTGFGLIPWRFRDLYWLLRYRFTSEKTKGREAKMYGLRKLAAIHNSWFRLPGSDTLDEQTSHQYLTSIGKAPSPVLSTASTNNLPPPHAATLDIKDKEHKTDPEMIRVVSRASLEAGADGMSTDERLPLPLKKTPPLPLTGVRAPPTRQWLLDFVIWCNVWNTFLQACLCGFMWGMNRYDRPSWSTGLFIALACIVAGVGGIVMFVQGKRIKRCEGVAPDGGSGAAVAITSTLAEANVVVK